MMFLCFSFSEEVVLSLVVVNIFLTLIVTKFHFQQQVHALVHDIFSVCQVGYWNEDEKYVTTASLMRGSNDTYGLQNRTYIVTTILVSRCKIDRKIKQREDDTISHLMLKDTKGKTIWCPEVHFSLQQYIYSALENAQYVLHLAVLPCSLCGSDITISVFNTT